MDEGLVRGLGVSNFSIAQVEELLAEARHKPLVNQVGGGGGRGRTARAQARNGAVFPHH